MNKAEWLVCEDAERLFRHVSGTVTVRKVRLFGCGCCRQAWSDRWPESCRRAVEVAEQFADGRAGEDDLQRARSRACQAAHKARSYSSRPLEDNPRWLFGRWLLFAADAAGPDSHVPYSTDMHVRTLGPTTPGMAPLVRCVFGMPFRLVPFDPAWRTSSALALAETIYADRLFDRLPILADAIEEAGCEDVELLAHCRGDGPHARGCWAVDAVLGRT